MSERPRRQRGDFVPLSRLAPPSGGPARLYERAREVRVREALGPIIGSQLLELREEGQRVVLILAGRGWERALAHELGALAERVAKRLGRPRVELSVCSQPEASPLRAAPNAGAGAPEQKTGPPPGREERRERLARIGARFEERRRDGSGER